MNYYKVLVFLITCLSFSYGREDKYCSLCENHTLCKYKSPGKNCKDIGGSGVTKNEIREILDRHNSYRREVASGRERRGAGGPQPKAANMMKLIWDDELAKIAQMWADQCTFKHDECRRVSRWVVGQNIFTRWQTPQHNVNWTRPIKSWYDEVELYNPKDVNSLRTVGSYGHYTQIVWHDTYAIGCGRRDYGPSKLYVCNYGPAGNYIGEPLYEIGEPCSRCPEGTICEENLCTFSHSKKMTLKHSDESKNNKENPYIMGNDGHTKSKAHNQTQQDHNQNDEHESNFLQQLLDDHLKSKSITNTIDENNIELDEETRHGIEEIKIKLENLVKKVIQKLKSQN